MQIWDVFKCSLKNNAKRSSAFPFGRVSSGTRGHCMNFNLFPFDCALFYFSLSLVLSRRLHINAEKAAFTLAPSVQELFQFGGYKRESPNAPRTITNIDWPINGSDNGKTLCSTIAKLRVRRTRNFGSSCKQARASQILRR